MAMINNFIDKNYETLLIILASLVAVFVVYNLGTLLVLVIKKLRRKYRRVKILPARISKVLKGIFRFRFKLFLFIDVLLVLFINAALYSIWKPLPKVISSTPSPNSEWSNPESPIVVEFSRPIDVKKLNIYLAPEVKGEWKPVKVVDQLPYVTKMKFIPDETVMPGEDVIVYVVGYNPKKIGEHMIEFKAPVLPNVSGSNVDQLATAFPLDGDIEINLDKKSEDYVNWRAEVTPATEFDLTIDKDLNKVIIAPKTRLKLATDYDIKLYRSTVSYNVKTKEVVEKTDEEMVKQLNFKSDTSALIAGVEPSGDKVYDDAAVIIKFGREVDHAQIEAKFAMEPTIEGDKVWVDNLNFKFTPKQKLAKDTTYKIKILQGLEYQAGIKTKEDMVFDFKTIGHVKVSKFNVSNNAQRVSVHSTFSVDFDQDVNHASAQQAFSISPTVGGTFSWNGNRMSFKPSSSLGYSKGYTITVNSGVKSIRGMDSNQDFKVAFKTEPEIFSLSVPYYRQVERFECELIATKMVLAYRGIYMSENQIMREIGVSTVPYNSSNNTWGDPNVYYVGDVTGASKGYGVHLDPLARVARAHGRRTQVYRGWNVAGIAKEVQNGNPVIILWQNGWSTPTDISWNTPEGKRIHAINGTHAGVVVGFKGSVDAPTAMIVQDPWYRGGPRRTYTISSFNGLWNYHGRSALVIY